MSIGDTLAQARREAGLSVTQVSQQTRIRESIVAAIEHDDFAPCGGDVYARGHVRSIAGVVGIDPAPLIGEYDQEHGAPGGMRAAQIFESATPIKIREPRNLHLGRILVVLLLAAIGFGAYRLVAGGTPGSRAATAPAVRPTVAVTTAPRTAPSVTASPVATRKPAPPRQAVIRLAAASDCWVGVTSASGNSLYQGIVPAGQSMTFTEKQRVSMVIGNPPGVTLTVNGKALPLNTVQVVTLTVDPLSKTPVKVG